MFQHYVLFWKKQPREAGKGGGYQKIEEKEPKNEDDCDDNEDGCDDEEAALLKENKHKTKKFMKFLFPWLI